MVKKVKMSKPVNKRKLEKTEEIFKSSKLRLVQLNNKKQKGLYVYVKAPKIRGRYYKMDGTLAVKDFIYYYASKNAGLIKDNIKEYKKNRQSIVNEGLRKNVNAKKRIILKNAYKKGVVSSEMKDVLSSTDGNIKKTVKNLVGKLAKPEYDIVLLSSEENMKKIRVNTELVFHIKGNEGETLAEIKTIGKKTPMEAILAIRNIFTKNMRIEPNYKHLMDEVSKAGFKMTYKGGEGFVNSIKMKVVLRK